MQMLDTMPSNPSETPKPSPGDLLEDPRARPREDLDSIFLTGEQDFGGADMMLSLPGGRNRGIWFFGDTILAKRDGGLKDFFHMPRNTVGIMRRKSDGGFHIKFYGGDAVDRRLSFFSTLRKTEWLWPSSACWVGNSLYVFLNRFRSDKKRRHEAFRFRAMGLHVVKISNPQRPPDQWEQTAIRLPRLAKSVYWGVASQQSGDYLYVMGRTKGNRPGGIVLARRPVNQLEQRGARWEYHRRRDEQSEWTTDSVGMTPVFSGGSNEISLSYFPKRKLYLAVYGTMRGVDDGNPHGVIGVRVAHSLEGPWSDYQEIFDPPENEWNPNYFCYAPKAHPEMTPGGDSLLITYATNSLVFDDLRNDPRIYFPKFIELKLKPAPGTGGKRGRT